jgi:hypothetical protein
MDDFYVEDNFIFKGEEIIDQFWEILMAHERENIYDRRVKPKFFESGAKKFSS